MQAGYEPGRVHELLRRTLEAIDSLGALASSDPAASEAVRTVCLARVNLEDHWMPALLDIERSDAMVRWRASRLGAFGLRSSNWLDGALADHLRPAGPTAISIPPQRRAELLARLDLLERRASNAAADRQAGVVPDVGPDPVESAQLARQVALWVTHDDEFADDLVDLSVSNMSVGRLLAEARFPSSFASQVVRRMASPNGPDTTVDRDRYAMSLSTALASLADEPAACLELLLEPSTTYALASWKALDTELLSEFVISGLHVAVTNDPDRLADGYEVLRLVTRAANGPLDGGMSAGMALGIAASLPGYIDTLAPAIGQEGETPVVIRAVDPPLELGTYDDLVDLFGAVVRVPDAQPALGTVLAAYTFDTFERVGAAATTRPDVTHLAEFADLIGDASRAEQAELVMAAAVEEARHRQLSGLIGFGTNVALMAGGASSVARTIVGQAVRLATDWRERGDSDRIAVGQIPARTYDLITLAAVTVAASDPSMRHDAGLDDVTTSQWAEAQRRIDAIALLDDPHARMLAVGDLDHWIASSVPALAAHLLEIRKTPGMSELKEGRNAVGAD